LRALTRFQLPSKEVSEGPERNVKFRILPFNLSSSQSAYTRLLRRYGPSNGTRYFINNKASKRCLAAPKVDAIRTGLSNKRYSSRQPCNGSQPQLIQSQRPQQLMDHFEQLRLWKHIATDMHHISRQRYTSAKRPRRMKQLINYKLVVPRKVSGFRDWPKALVIHYDWGFIAK
jgi:hypothetical protein